MKTKKKGSKSKKRKITFKGEIQALTYDAFLLYDPRELFSRLKSFFEQDNPCMKCKISEEEIQ